MRRKFRLRLEPMEKGSPIEASFGEHDIVFLISNCSGLSLCSEPDLGGLMHAVFLFQKGKVFAIPLRDDLYLKDGCASQLRNEEIIELGSRKLRVVLVRPCFARRTKALSLTIALLILSAALATSYSGRVVPKNMHPAIAEQAEPQTKSKTEFVEEAKIHMRAGEVDQARLALMEEIDRNPTNKEALDLIEALGDDKFSAGSNYHSNELKVVAEAKDAYESGRQFMKERHFAKAHEFFEKAVKRLSSVKTVVPFRSALLNAEKSALSMLERELAPKLFRAKGLLDAALQKDTREAMGMLIQAFSITESITKSLPQNMDANSLHEMVREGIRVMSDRSLSAAQEVERLSGCSKAISEYENIARQLKNINSNIASIAKRRAGRCRASVGGGL